MKSILEEALIDNKPVSEYLSDDPLTSKKAAYQLLNIFWHLVPFGHKSRWFKLIEDHLKRQFRRFMTGEGLLEQSDEDIANTSLLEAMSFFQQIGKEAECLTAAINDVWIETELIHKANREEVEFFIDLGNRIKAGDEFALKAFNYIKREMYRPESPETEKET